MPRRLLLLSSYASCVRNGSGIRAYAVKRPFLSYPAYATVILTPAALWFALRGPSAELARFLAANLSTFNFLHPCLGSLFTGLQYCAVNGALWTIKNELILYGSIPFFFWLLTSHAPSRNEAMTAALIFVGASTYFYFFLDRGNPLLAKQFPSGITYFLAGSVMVWLTEDNQPQALRALEASIPARSATGYTQPSD